MMNFKDEDERPISFIMAGSILVIICSVIFMILSPKPAPALTENQVRTIANRTWTGTPEEVLPIALQKVATMAQAHHLKIVGFHPQTVIVAPSITLIPCVVNVDGSFVNVVAFEKDIEGDSTNLTVNLMQLATADQETNKVTASIGVVAYQPLKEAPSATETVTPQPAKIKQGGKKNA